MIGAVSCTVGFLEAAVNELFADSAEIPDNLAPLDSAAVQMMAKGRFAGNRWMEGAQNPFFPERCLGCGCARRAMESSIAFVRQFFGNLGIAFKYEEMLVGLVPLPR